MNRNEDSAKPFPFGRLCDVVQTSTNLNSATNWYTIHTNLVSFWYTNFPTTNDRQRFYQAITNTEELTR